MLPQVLSRQKPPKCMRSTAISKWYPSRRRNQTRLLPRRHRQHPQINPNIDAFCLVVGPFGMIEPDGVNWVQVGSTQTISIAQSVYIGLALSANNNSAVATASFHN